MMVVVWYSVINTARILIHNGKVCTLRIAVDLVHMNKSPKIIERLTSKIESLGNHSWNNFSKNVPEESCWELDLEQFCTYMATRINDVSGNLFC